MKLRKACLYKVHLPLVTPFRTSYGLTLEKSFYLLELYDEKGNVGYGELEAFPLPEYTEETLEGAKLILTSLLLNEAQGQNFSAPEEVSEYFRWIKGNEMAKAMFESACYDLFAKREGVSLAKLLGAENDEVAVGVSIGIQNSEADLLSAVADFVEEGYSRVKMKIKPGQDLSYLAAVREQFPNLVLFADANSAYTEAEFDILLKMDHFDLAMIEQPFGTRDFLLHAKLQQKIRTPICLDENIRELGDVQQAYAFGSCQAVNLKMARVGGFHEALRIAEFCEKHQMTVWCGGMLEAGVGRAHNLALAARKEFKFPGDISATKRYFKEDIIKKDFELVNGKIHVPQGVGIGVEIDYKALKRFTKSTETILLD